MSGGLSQVFYDPADSSTSTVGSYTLDGAGTAIDSKLIDTEQWLNSAAAVHDGDGQAVGGGAMDVDNVADTEYGLNARGFLYGFDGGAWDRLLADETPGALNVHVVGSNTGDDLADTSVVSESRPVGTTATAVTASVLANRKWLFLANEGTKKMYWGGSGVTTAAGFPLYKRMQHFLRIGPTPTVEIIGEAGAAAEDIRVLQAS